MHLNEKPNIFYAHVYPHETVDAPCSSDDGQVRSATWQTVHGEGEQLAWE